MWQVGIIVPTTKDQTMPSAVEAELNHGKEILEKLPL